MRIFLDTADTDLIAKHYNTGLIDGITTNPTLIMKSGRNPEDVYKEIADIGVIEARNQVRQTIETSFNDALAASKSYSASQKQVRALEESFRIIKSQYNLGSINYTEYQISNNNLVRATNDLLSSKYDYIFKLKVLDFYQGKKLTF